jgi:S-adenosylmethionine synthetase
MGTEAAAGKNPVSHVGKIYNVLSHQLARKIFDEIEGLKEVYVLLLSRIGMPIDRPVLAAAQVIPGKGQGLEEINGPIQDIFMHALAEMDDFCRRLARGDYPVC